MTTKDIGDIGESIAAKFLKKNGYKIKARNIHISHNEIDIIAENKDYLVFVEVKARTADPDNVSRFGVPSSAVTYAKQRRLIEAARAYIRENLTEKQPRMDVVEVWLDDGKKALKINHIQNAYGAK